MEVEWDVLQLKWPGLSLIGKHSGFNQIIGEVLVFVGIYL